MNGGEKSGEGRRLENPIKKEEGGKEVPEGKERERNHFEDWGRREGSPPDLQ